MERLTDDNPLPLFYCQIAWDIMLAPDEDTRHSLIGQALRDFDHHPILLALSQCGLTMRAALDFHDPTKTATLRDEWMEMAKEIIT